MRRFVTLIFALLIILTLPISALAAGTQPTGTRSFVLENDLFYNIDRHYTNGVRLAWVTDREGWNDMCREGTGLAGLKPGP